MRFTAVLIVCLLAGSNAGAAEPDWKAVGQALGKPGQVQAYVHFWAVESPATLAQGLRAALDQTNSQR